MNDIDIIYGQIRKLKGISLILACMSVENMSGMDHENMSEALDFLADQIYDIAAELDTIQAQKESEQ